ncbi:G-alpha-domain-containing protein [Rhizoclosmatium globosum]|uniref:G-alpha-domain-containing protein n=1 Tax=Rhizoclosmatium globosum TaxID=329046 RepID=A0A1Y2BQB0_9FUNG|nr:G-alpha-domain-containing protein [Rhizoclosmatium globosum]|eukprot:ORY36928.1 G-alpha-domain-containing protein [Rhizoclosmatium globosum]
MKIIYKVGFTPSDLKTFHTCLHLNIYTCITTLIAAMDALSIPFGFDPLNPSNDRRSSNMSRASESQGNIGNKYSGLPMIPDPFERKRSGSFVRSNSKSSTLLPVGRDLARQGSIAQTAKHLYDSDREREKRRLDRAGTSRVETPVEIAVKYLLSNSVHQQFITGEGLSEQVVNAIETVWSDCGIQYCYTRSNEYQLLDSCSYLMKNLTRICASNFVPTEEDILHTRIKTTTVTETKFTVEGVLYRVFDVGGQRSERRKWAAHFDNVEAIIFLVAISSYDQACADAEGMNRMIESINVFNSICNHPLFKNTSTILFFNKIDLFREKIKTSPIQSYFPDFHGGENYDEGCLYFEKKFLDLNRVQGKQIFTHFTWATDTKQIAKILKDVRASILKLNLQIVGLQ